MSVWKPRHSAVAAVSAATFAAAMGVAPAAFAQAYPSQAIKMVVPFPPGQASDTYMRLIGERMSARMGQPVIVENRAGAGGAIGMSYGAAQKPDGYTIIMGGSGSMSINPTLQPSTVKYDPLKDFEPIAAPVAVAQVFVVLPGSPIKSVPDLIQAAKAKPGDLTYGSSGAGTTQHLFVEQFASSAGIKLMHVPYKGSAPAMTDLLGGQITMVSDTVTALLPQIQAGKVRAIGVTSPQRSPSLPEVPTIAEQGVRGYSAVGWISILAPAGTPAAIADRLHNEVNIAMADPEIKKKVLDLGFVEMNIPRARVREFIAAEGAKWKKVIQDANVPIQ